MQGGHRHSPASRVRAFLERAVAPGYGRCRCCGRPWSVVDPHVTLVSDWDSSGESRGGRFCLCEGCWTELLPQTRVGFYEAAFGHQEAWPSIRHAVLRESPLTLLD